MALVSPKAPKGLQGANCETFHGARGTALKRSEASFQNGGRILFLAGPTSGLLGLYTLLGRNGPAFVIKSNRNSS